MSDVVPRLDLNDEFQRDARRFRLVRDEDESGVSGEGIVAVGVAFPSGTVVMEWLNDENEDLDTQVNGLSIKPGETGVRDTELVHGHEGRTRIEWIDPSRQVREGDAEVCPSCGDEYPLSALVEGDGRELSCPECNLILRPFDADPNGGSRL